MSVGPAHSYQAVARFFQVDKKTLLKRAKAVQWQPKLVELERTAQENTEKKYVNSLEEMNERHLRLLRLALGRALEALRATPLRTADAAVRAIDK